MSLYWWWMIPALVVVILGLALWWWFRRPQSSTQPVPVAHVDRLTALPRYAKARKQRAQAVVVLGISTLVIFLGALFAASRPAESTSTTPESSSRDIMLCLDISGSMVKADAEIAEEFSTLAKGFKGERLGLVIFDSTGVQVFPLTDDYDFLSEQLETAKKALKDPYGNYSFFSGTFSSGGSSLIGDGLATCVSSFTGLKNAEGKPETTRSRSIIFATDNLLSGKPIYSLKEATDLAIQNKIRVYGINPNTSSSTRSTAAAQDMKTNVESTQGQYFSAKDSGATAQIIQQVQSTEAAKTKGAPSVSVIDHPEFWLLLMGVGALGFIVGVWRFRS